MMTSGRRALAFGIVCLFFLGVLPTAAAASPGSGPAMFALVVGSNISVDAKLPALHYADDDAARYFDLFRFAGMRTLLLTRLDESTRRLHPAAAAEARPPVREELARAAKTLAADVERARADGLETVLYVVFGRRSQPYAGAVPPRIIRTPASTTNTSPSIAAPHHRYWLR